MSTVQVKGATTLALTMRVAALDMADLADAGRTAISNVAATGRARAPRRSGQLAGSISTHTNGNEAEATSGLVYAGRTHYGWPAVRQAAQPFLTDALATQEKATLDAYMDSVLKALNKVRGA